MSQNWFTYKEGKVVEYDSIDKFPEKCIGFVYKITHIQSGRFYIGKKSEPHSFTKHSFNRTKRAGLESFLAWLA